MAQSAKPVQNKPLSRGRRRTTHESRLRAISRDCFHTERQQDSENDSGSAAGDLHGVKSPLVINLDGPVKRLPGVRDLSLRKAQSPRSGMRPGAAPGSGYCGANRPDPHRLAHDLVNLSPRRTSI